MVRFRATARVFRNILTQYSLLLSLAACWTTLILAVLSTDRFLSRRLSSERAVGAARDIADHELAHRAISAHGCLSAEHGRGTIVRIVGRSPQWRGNRPDQWERSALGALAGGAREVAEVVELDGRRQVRVMKPIRGEPAGGLSVKAPVDTGASPLHARVQAAGYSGLWLAGLGGLVFAGRWVQGHRRRWKDSEAGLRAPIDLTDGREVWAGADGRYVSISPSCEPITGYRPDEFVSDPGLMARMIHPDDQAARAKHVEETGAGGPGWSMAEITHQKRLDDERRERETLHRAVIETSADGFWVTDLEGRILDVNDAYIRRSGYSREELTSMRICDLDAVENPEENAAHIASVVSTGSEVFETRQRSKDGTIWLAEVSATHWSIDGGRLFVFVRDLVQRARSEALLRTRIRLSDIAETSDLNRLLQAALDEAELLTGSRIGFFHFVDDDQQNLTLQAWSSNTTRKMCQAAGQGSHYSIDQAGVWAECFHQRAPVIHSDYATLPNRRGMPDGHAVVVRALTVPILRQDRVAAILGVGNKSTDYSHDDVEIAVELGSIVMDLVDRKRAEQALRSSEERHRAVVSSASDGIILQGRTGEILSWNKEAERIFGLTAAEVLGRRSIERNWATSHEDGSEWPAHEHPSLHTLATGEACRNVVMGVRSAAGQFSWISISTNPISEDGDSQVSGVVIAFSDITLRKRMEDHLRALLAEKEVLLREVHHRVKNNLAAISGLIDLQRNERGGQSIEEALGDLSRRIRAIALVHEKLYQADNLASVNFQVYLQSLVAELRSFLAAPADLELSVSAPVLLSLDLAVPCGMIVSELVTNALKHAFPAACGVPGGGRPGIAVSMHEDGEACVLQVADNGIGLPGDLDLASTGTLGLRLVRMLGEHQLGGQIRIDRTGGTRYALRFTLPHSRTPKHE